MVTNLFSKKANKRSVVKKSPLATTLPNDEASLQARAERRHQVDFENICLDVRNQTTEKHFEKSFLSLVRKHPHHELLIKQLLHSSKLDIGSRLVSYTVHQHCYTGIEEFVEFLNAQDQPHHKSIRNVADIDFQTTRNFVAYLLQFYPGRTVNRKHYGSVRALASILQHKYDSNPFVGKAFVWAKAPAVSDKPSESYSDEVFNQLIEASLTDIKSIMKMMIEYPDQVKAVKQAESALKRVVHSNGIILGMSRKETNLICSAVALDKFAEWPFFETLTTASDRFSQRWNNDLALDDRLNRNLQRVMSSMRIANDIKFQGSGETQSADIEVGQLAYICQSFFTFQTVFPFILFVQINTGWNIEAVLNLTDDLDSHFGEDLVDPDEYVLIYSEKSRTDNVLYCRSSKTHPYSVYNILKFVQRTVGVYKNSPHYCAGYLWQSIIAKQRWSREGRIAVSVNRQHFRRASSVFVRRHGISIKNNAAVPGLESRRIRTTYETKRKEQGVPIESISEMMGHEDLSVTDIHYDRDSGSNNLRNKKLRELQIKWDHDLRNYGTKLSLSVSLTQLRQAIGTATEKSIISTIASQLSIDEKAVVRLLSPSGQTYIAACLDSKSPSWPNAERFIPSGEKCVYFNRCCMCDQAVLFKESLPFVVRRIIDLTGLKARINSFEWSSNYDDEATAWAQILARWNPSSDVDAAKECAMNPEFALPLTMRGAR